MRLYVANHNPVPRAHVTFVTFRRTRVTWGPGARLHQPMKRNLEFPREFRHKKRLQERFPGRALCLLFLDILHW